MATVVYAALVLSTALLALYVVRYGRNVPYADDLELVPVLSGHEPVTFDWFFVLQNEHRLPLARLVILAVFRLTHDLRVVMCLTVAVHVAVAFLFVRTAREIRGRSSLIDVVFPLALVAGAVAENVIWTIEFYFVSPSLLTAVLVAIATRDRWRGSKAALTSIGAALAALPLSGASGVLMSVPFAVWCAFAAARRRREGGPVARRDAVVLAVSIAVWLTLTAYYLHGYESRGYRPAAFSLRTTLETCAQALAMGIGPAATRFWPASFLAVALPLAVGLGLALDAFRRAQERSRALALVCGFASAALAVGAIGYARAGFGPTPGFATRYQIFAATALCFACLSIVLYGRRLANPAVGLVIALLVAAFPTNYAFEKEYGYSRAMLAEAMTREARRNVPPLAIAARYTPQEYPSSAILAERLDMLRRQGTSLYAGVDTSPPTRVVEVPVRVVETNQLRADGGRWICEGADPFLVLSIGSPVDAVAIDVTFVLERPGGANAALQAFWKRDGFEAFDPRDRNDVYVVASSVGEQTVTLWVNGLTDTIRLDPDAAPGTFEVRRIRVRQR